MFCSNCGEEIKEDNKFCPKCDFKVVADLSEKSEEQEELLFSYKRLFCLGKQITTKNKKLFLNREDIKLFLFRHHPKCEKFNGHTFKIGSIDFCIGCFIGYPTAFSGILIIYLLGLVITFRSGFLLLIGTFLLSSFILSPLHLTNIKSIKIIQKFFIGLGFAFLFWGIWTLPNSFIFNLFLFIIIFGILYGLIMSYHAYSFYNTCKNCEFSRNWEKCPGFRNV